MQAFTISQLLHTEILSPKPDETVAFFEDLLGMQESAREGQSVYLRGYQDTFHHSLVVTESDQAGLGHVAWRATSAEALEQVATKVEATGLGSGWSDSEIGAGRTYRFATPEGHQFEVGWEYERAPVPPGEESAMPNAPQKRPIQGVPVRRIDHLGLMCRNVDSVKRFVVDTLTFRSRERVSMDGGETDFGAWLSVTPVPHEISLVTDMTGVGGRLHHVCFWYGVEQHLNDIAEVLRDRGIPIEAGPSKHGVSQSPFLYCFEPGGNRIELFGGYGYLCLEADWEERTWTPENLPVGASMYGLELPPTFFAYGTPQIDIDDAALMQTLKHDVPTVLPAS